MDDGELNAWIDGLPSDDVERRDFLAAVANRVIPHVKISERLTWDLVCATTTGDPAVIAEVVARVKSYAARYDEIGRRHGDEPYPEGFEGQADP